MLKQPILGIGTRQIVCLLPELSLGNREDAMAKALTFKMPTLQEVYEYAQEHLKELHEAISCESEETIRLTAKFSRLGEKWIQKQLAIMNSFNEEDKRLLGRAHYYYKGNVLTLQKRLTRYTLMLMAIEGLLDVKQHQNVAMDLEECDINLANSRSVQSGRQRVHNSLKYVLIHFNEFAEKAAKMTSYIDRKLAYQLRDIWWFSDEERFGSDKLCITNFGERLGLFHPELYVKSTKKQQQEEAKRWEKSVDAIVKSMAEVFKDSNQT